MIKCIPALIEPAWTVYLGCTLNIIVFLDDDDVILSVDRSSVVLCHLCERVQRTLLYLEEATEEFQGTTFQSPIKCNLNKHVFYWLKGNFNNFTC